jgi:peptide/nickel transport system substrate-binding protein
MLESATAFAEQAKQAGVTIDVQNVPADQYFGENYLKQNFAQTLWFSEPIIGNLSKSLVEGAPFNETHWADPAFQRTYEELLRTVDETKRAELYAALQEQLWNEGGYLIWGFFPLLDGLAANVRGAIPNAAQPLSHYDFKSYWLA